MAAAIKQAKRAFAEDEVPIGCVIVCDGKIIARAHNKKQQMNDSTCHAEMLALKKAQKVKGEKYLYDCTVYVTIEPCAMCAGAMINTRVGALVFGAYEPKTGCFGSVINIADIKFNHEISVMGGVMEKESKVLLQDFFKEKRKK